MVVVPLVMVVVVGVVTGGHVIVGVIVMVQVQVGQVGVVVVVPGG